MPRNPRAMGRQGIGIVIGLVIMGVLAGYVLPIGISAITDDSATSTIDHTVGDDAVELTPTLEANVTEVQSGTPNNATVVLTDTQNDDTVTQTIDASSTATLSLTGGDVDVTVDSVDTTGDGSATVTYEYSDQFGWDDASVNLYTLIPLILILIIVIALLGWAMDSF